MKNNIFLGIDTSCYTTSISVIDLKGTIVLDKRKKLQVKKGQIGLRQSDMFFQHVSNLSKIFEEISKEINLKDISAIGVSKKPRNSKDSYMPVFKSGYYFAKNISYALNVKLYAYSHQEGHIMASITSSNFQLDSEKFLVYHLSGGTNELLITDYKNNRFNSEIIGGTLDITAGQLIDRIGVKSGLEFPAGKKMEEIAGKSDSKEIYPITVKGCYINFSGIESYGNNYVNQIPNKDNFLNIFNSINESIFKSLRNAVEKYGINKILLTGGVSSNTYLRDYLKNKFNDIYFGTVNYSTDNAVGIAYLTLKEFSDNNEN